jgi:hypothetical protein
MIDMGFSAMTVVRSMVAALLAAAAVAGCSTQKPPPIAEPNVLPTDYRNQIAAFLSTVLIDRADFSSAQIGTPVLQQVGSSEHYVVCILFNGRNEHREKVAVYLASNINQIVDAQPGQCAGTAYQPFTELAALLPRK